MWHVWCCFLYVLLPADSEHIVFRAYGYKPHETLLLPILPSGVSSALLSLFVAASRDEKSRARTGQERSASSTLPCLRSPSDLVRFMVRRLGAQRVRLRLENLRICWSAAALLPPS